MKYTEEEKDEFQHWFKSLYNDPRILFMDGIPQHRGSTTYEHTIQVAKLAYRMARKLPFRIDIKSMLRGAMLHDYFLYNWRTDREKLKGHGHNHPKIAAKNAARDYDLNKKEIHIIECHMWPINLFHFPYGWEAFLVSLSDKIIGTKEALTSKAYKDKHRSKYMHNVKKLEKTKKDY